MSETKTKRRLSISVIVDSDVADRLPSSISSKELIELLLKTNYSIETKREEQITAENTTVPLDEVNSIIETKFTNILNSVLSKFNFSGSQSNAVNLPLGGNEVVSDTEEVDFFASFAINNNITLPNNGDVSIGEEEEEFIFDLTNFKEG